MAPGTPWICLMDKQSHYRYHRVIGQSTCHWHLWQFWNHITVFTIIFVCTFQKSEKIFFSKPHTFMQVELKKWSMKDKNIVKQNYLLILINCFTFTKWKPVLLFSRKYYFFFFLLKGLDSKREEEWQGSGLTLCLCLIWINLYKTAE